MSFIQITSGFNFEGYKITNYLGFLSRECALGTGFLSSLGASFADFLGTNSSMYSSKLDSAKNYAIEKLKEEVINIGGNAIIGIDIDYTTFSKDIIGVIASGTAVCIEKIKDKALEKNNIEKTFQVMNYNPDSKIRPYEVLLAYVSENVFIQLKCISYSKAVMAFKGSIYITNIFNEKLEINDISFYDLMQNNNEIITEYVKVAAKLNNFVAIKSVEVIINKYVINENVIVLPENDIKITIDTNTLQDMKNLNGKDVVCDFNEESENFVWTCMCGHVNKNGQSDCELCHRTKAVNNNIWETLIKNITELNTAKDILYYLKDFDKKYDNLLPKDVLDIAESSYGIERLYGNNKTSCVQKIKIRLNFVTQNTLQ